MEFHQTREQDDIRLSASVRDLSISAFFTRLRDEAGFRLAWSRAVKNIPYDSYYWEMPPLYRQNAGSSFECRFVPARNLSFRQDKSDFAEHFSTGKQVAIFDNLGGDARLVVPAPGAALTNYSQLATFMQTAPDQQVSALWQAVGETVTKMMNEMPLWVSTSGAGVAWLHIRLDKHPKYYQTEEYRNWRVGL